MGYYRVHQGEYDEREIEEIINSEARYGYELHSIVASSCAISGSSSTYIRQVEKIDYKSESNVDFQIRTITTMVFKS